MNLIEQLDAVLADNYPYTSGTCSAARFLVDNAPELSAALRLMDEARKVPVQSMYENGMVVPEGVVMRLGQDGTKPVIILPAELVKPAECANGCPPQQVCDYCQVACKHHRPQSPQ